MMPRRLGRVTNILDIHKLTPYFFVEPDYGSQEAESMVKSIPQADIGRVQSCGSKPVASECRPFSKDFTDVVPRLELVESWTEMS